MDSLLKRLHISPYYEQTEKGWLHKRDKVVFNFEKIGEGYIVAEGQTQNNNIKMLISQPEEKLFLYIRYALKNLQNIERFKDKFKEKYGSLPNAYIVCPSVIIGKYPYAYKSVHNWELEEEDENNNQKTIKEKELEIS